MTEDGWASLRARSHAAFQVWLAGEVEAREALEGLMAAELTLETDSLAVLERFLLARYGDPDDALKPGERGVLDGAARHIGLVMLMNIDGAEWGIELDDPKDVYYQLPVIRLPDGAHECPLSLATACLDRRTGHYLREVVESYVAEFNEGDG